MKERRYKMKKLIFCIMVLVVLVAAGTMVSAVCAENSSLQISQEVLAVMATKLPDITLRDEVPVEIRRLPLGFSSITCIQYEERSHLRGGTDFVNVYLNSQFTNLNDGYVVPFSFRKLPLTSAGFGYIIFLTREG
jgi:hypothetical protein